MDELKKHCLLLKKSIFDCKTDLDPAISKKTCKITQTISPIRVDLGYKRRYTDEPRFSLDVTYVTRVTQQKTPIIISCTLLSTGEEIKKSATVKILLDKTITYPEEFQTLTFRTENKSFNFHGNTTLLYMLQLVGHTLPRFFLLLLPRVIHLVVDEPSC